MTTEPVVRRRMRSASISLGITAVMASSLTGCATSADYAAVCVDPDTQERVADDQCDDDSDYNGAGTGFFWYYLGASSRVPAIGQSATGGTYRGSTLNGTFELISILPPRCSRNVRSLTLCTSTPSIAATEVCSSTACSPSAAEQVTSRRSLVALDSTMSIPVTTPPRAAMSVATAPTTPWSGRVCSRMVME